MVSIVPILAGGGTRLPAHIGVLQALKDLEILFNIQNKPPILVLLQVYMLLDCR